MSVLIEYAKRELEFAKLFGDNDFYGGMTGKAGGHLRNEKCKKLL